MADDQDWRLRAKVDGGAGALDHLLASVRGEAGADVAITHDGGNLLFAYTASRDEIVSTKSALQEAARRGAIEASIDVSHWDGDVDGMGPGGPAADRAGEERKGRGRPRRRAARVTDDGGERGQDGAGGSGADDA